MKAVVLGGTGAVGQEIVRQLLSSQRWSEVTTIGRRPVTLPEALQGQEGKLKQKVIDMDNMVGGAADAFSGADVVFCALGTTRKDAGSAAQFKKVDYEYVATAAQLAKAAGVPRFSLVSSQGANANVPAGDFALFHGLLYSKTKGRAEEAVKAQGFERTAIWRPGMLGRGDKARPIEAFVGKLLSSIPAADVAKVMIQDAEKSIEQGVKGAQVFEMKAMQEAVKAAT